MLLIECILDLCPNVRSIYEIDENFEEGWEGDFDEFEHKRPCLGWSAGDNGLIDLESSMWLALPAKEHYWAKGWDEIWGKHSAEWKALWPTIAKEAAEEVAGEALIAPACPIPYPHLGMWAKVRGELQKHLKMLA
jgi:hypothetical protein